MEGFALVVLVLIGLALVYKLGLFGPIIDLSNVATRESAAYNREHKSKVAKRYLNNAEYTFGTEDITKINANIKAIDELKFD